MTEDELKILQRKTWEEHAQKQKKKAYAESKAKDEEDKRFYHLEPETQKETK